MPMNPGDKTAADGLAKVIYDAEQAHKARLEDLAPFDPSNETAAVYQARVVKAIDDSSKERAFDIANAIIEHFKTNAVIKTELDTGSRTIETYLAGLGDKGGGLQAGVNPVVGSVKTSKDSSATGTIE